MPARNVENDLTGVIVLDSAVVSIRLYEPAMPIVVEGVGDYREVGVWPPHDVCSSGRSDGAPGRCQ